MELQDVAPTRSKKSSFCRLQRHKVTARPKKLTSFARKVLPRTRNMSTRIVKRRDRRRTVHTPKP